MSEKHVCIRCGDGYSFTNVYKGNYCAECHDWWLEHQRAGKDRPRRRVARRSRGADDERPVSRHGSDGEADDAE
jgi:hypothetical protein